MTTIQGFTLTSHCEYNLHTGLEESMSSGNQHECWQICGHCILPGLHFPLSTDFVMTPTHSDTQTTKLVGKPYTAQEYAGV